MKNSGTSGALASQDNPLNKSNKIINIAKQSTTALTGLYPETKKHLITAISAVIGIVVALMLVLPGGRVDMQFIYTVSEIKSSIYEREQVEQDALKAQALAFSVGDTSEVAITPVANHGFTNKYGGTDIGFVAGIVVVAGVAVSVFEIFISFHIDDRFRILNWSLDKARKQQELVKKPSFIAEVFAQAFVLSFYLVFALSLIIVKPVTDSTSAIYQQAEIIAEKDTQEYVDQMQYNDALIEEYITALQDGDTEKANLYLNLGAGKILSIDK